MTSANNMTNLLPVKLLPRQAAQCGHERRSGWETPSDRADREGSERDELAERDHQFLVTNILRPAITKPRRDGDDMTIVLFTARLEVHGSNDQYN